MAHLKQPSARMQKKLQKAIRKHTRLRLQYTSTRHESISIFSSPYSQTATELEVSADSDQKELLLLLAVEWSLVVVFTLQPRDLRTSRS